MQVDAKWGFWLALVVAFLQATVQGTIVFPGYIPHEWMAYLVDTNKFLLDVWVYVLGPAAFGLSSSKAGPLITK